MPPYKFNKSYPFPNTLVTVSVATVMYCERTRRPDARAVRLPTPGRFTVDMLRLGGAEAEKSGVHAVRRSINSVRFWSRTTGHVFLQISVWP